MCKQAAHSSRLAASSLAFNPSSGTILTTDSQAQQTAAPGSLAFDPSSSTILTSQSTQPHTTPGNASQNSEELQAGLGPTTLAAASQFTPRSESTQFIGRMLRSDLAAEVHLLKPWMLHNTPCVLTSDCKCCSDAKQALALATLLGISSLRCCTDVMPHSQSCKVAKGT